MKTRSCVLLLALVLLLSGCQLAQPDAAGENGLVNRDPLIGVYLTPEYLDLFDMEGWLNDNLDQLGEDMIVEGDTSAYEGRLYATYDEARERWDFEGLEGHSMFAWERVEDWGTSSVIENTGGLADSHFATKVTDYGTENDMTATLYVEPADIVCWYVNPVYQDTEGKVYLMAGTGNSFSDRTGSVGMSTTQTLSGEETFTDTDGKTVTNKTTCEVTIQTRRAAELLRIVWMDADHSAIRTEEYAPAAMPPELEAYDAAYLVVEEQNHDGTVTYSIAQRDSDEGKSVRVYAPGEYGVLVAHDVSVLWEDTSVER